MKKPCELCKSPAKVYCDSDQASLCWSCDNKVHSANFLVARHSRTLLCRLCHSPTPWTASGQTLGPSAVSICQKCIGREESHGANDVHEDVHEDVHDDDVNDDDVDDDDEYDGDEDGEDEFDVDDEDEDEEDGGENQVVPLCYTPPPAASSSSSDDCSVGDRGVSVKRKRENVADLSSEDDDSVHKNHRPVTTAELYHFLPLSSEAMGEKPKKIHHGDMISGENAAVPVAGVCKGTTTTTTTTTTRAVGLDLNS